MFGWSFASAICLMSFRGRFLGLYALRWNLSLRLMLIGLMTTPELSYFSIPFHLEDVSGNAAKTLIAAKGITGNFKHGPIKLVRFCHLAHYISGDRKTLPKIIGTRYTACMNSHVKIDLHRCSFQRLILDPARPRDSFM